MKFQRRPYDIDLLFVHMPAIPRQFFDAQRKHVAGTAPSLVSSTITQYLVFAFFSLYVYDHERTRADSPKL